MIDQIEKLIIEFKLEKYFTKKYFDYFLFTVALVIVIYADWGIKEILMVIIALIVFLNPVKSEIYSKIALVLLVLTPITLAMGRDIKAEKLAMAVYGFLVLTIIISIIEYKKERQKPLS